MHAMAPAPKRSRPTKAICPWTSLVIARVILIRRWCLKGSDVAGCWTRRLFRCYARGLTVSEIQGHLEELYGTEVSKGLISTVTNAVWDEVTAWQNRPLDSVYPIVYFDTVQPQSSKVTPKYGITC